MRVFSLPPLTVLYIVAEGNWSPPAVPATWRKIETFFLLFNFDFLFLLFLLSCSVIYAQSNVNWISNYNSFFFKNKKKFFAPRCAFLWPVGITKPKMWRSPKMKWIKKGKFEFIVRRLHFRPLHTCEYNGDDEFYEPRWTRSCFLTYANVCAVVVVALFYSDKLGWDWVVVVVNRRKRWRCTAHTQPGRPYSRFLFFRSNCVHRSILAHNKTMSLSLSL